MTDSAPFDCVCVPTIATREHPYTLSLIRFAGQGRERHPTGEICLLPEEVDVLRNYFLTEELGGAPLAPHLTGKVA